MSWDANQVDIIMEGIREGKEFMDSPRGQLIVAQALYIASKELKKVTPEVLQEKSNISNMEYLLDTLYSSYVAVFNATESIRESRKNYRNVN